MNVINSEFITKEQLQDALNKEKDEKKARELLITAQNYNRRKYNTEKKYQFFGSEQLQISNGGGYLIILR